MTHKKAPVKKTWSIALLLDAEKNKTLNYFSLKDSLFTIKNYINIYFMPKKPNGLTNRSSFHYCLRGLFKKA